MSTNSSNKIIVGNWKSHKTFSEASIWADEFTQYLVAHTISVPTHATVIVAPSFHLLSQLQELVSTGVRLGVQDISPFSTGSYTGAISASQLSQLQVEYAVVGHSERRRFFSETHQDVAKKVDQCLSTGIVPIVCVDRDYIDAQAAAIDPAQLSHCIVAYEPLSAIGSGHSEDVGTVKEVAAHIRSIFGDIPVLYGGSVDDSDILEYTLVSDGVLIGGASLEAREFGECVVRVINATT